MKTKITTGYVSGRLTVVRRANVVDCCPVFECKCSCGNTVFVKSGTLACKKRKSCGCLTTDHIKKLHDLNTLPGEEGAFRHAYRIHKFAVKRRGGTPLTQDEFRIISQKDCHYCGCPPSNCSKKSPNRAHFAYNGLDRVDNSRGYYADNVVPCCINCNGAKRERTQREFIDWAWSVHDKNLLSSVEMAVVRPCQQLHPQPPTTALTRCPSEVTA